MRRFALTLLSCSLVLGLAACDKADSKKAADAKKGADAKKAEPDKGGEDKAGDDKAGDDKAGDAKAGDDKPAADDYVDDTKGVAAVLRAAAGDSTAPAAGDPPKYDTTKDAGGLIGHLASGLSHDEALAESKTAKTLAKLGGKDGSASDDALCNHVWDTIKPAAFADLGDDKKDGFLHDCEAELEKERVKLGVEIFAQHSACVMAAADLAALDLCDAAEQAAEDDLHSNPHGDSPDPKLCTAAVEQIFILINRDMVEDPDLLEILQEHIDVIKEDAKLACRDEGTKAELQCVMKAPDLAGLEGCLPAQ